MYITLLQENLLKSLLRTQRIITTKAELPILTHVLLSAKENSLKLVSTNLETTIQVTCGAKIEQEGDICIPSRLVTEFVSTLPKESVSLVVETDSITIKAGRSKATIPGVAATEFPPIPEIQENTGVDIDKKQLTEALSLVLFAAANDESRPLLTGIRIEKTAQGTIFIATDGYRLSTKIIPEVVIAESTVVIPSRALIEVLKLSQEEKEVKQLRLIETVEGQLQFVIGDTRISTRRIEGEYPNYKRIIPASYTTRSTIDSEEFARAVKSAAIFARDSAGIIKFTVAPEGITISANTPQVGENTVEIDAEVEGEGGTIAINSRFLLDLLNNLSGDQLVLEMTGALNPAVFKLPSDEHFLHIIMPVRVQS